VKSSTGIYLEKKLLSRDKIVGMQVIDSNGMLLGTIKDIAFDIPSAKMALTIVDDKGKATEVASEDVTAVGDVVLLKKPETKAEMGVRSAASALTQAPAPTRVGAQGPATVPSPTPGPAVTPSAAPAAATRTVVSGLCPNCAYQNEQDSRFCIKCGTKLK
jgi:sporulation protein YlmC with PRC-barrel domain